MVHGTIVKKHPLNHPTNGAWCMVQQSSKHPTITPKKRLLANLHNQPNEKTLNATKRKQKI